MQLCTAMGQPDVTVRQQRDVVVDGVVEKWRLEWQGKVTPTCGASELSTVSTCPCTGVSYGEQGKLFLVRARPLGAIERLALAGLVSGQYDSMADEGSIALRRWQRQDGDPLDEDSAEAKSLPIAVAKRPLSDAMVMGDYDHDGAQTEFLVRIGHLPCGRQMMVLVGTSKKNPRLHAFSSLAHPERPLVLQLHEWQAMLRAQGPVTVLDWPCDDHGSENEIEKTLFAHEGIIEVHRRVYSCPRKAQGQKPLWEDAE
ncbi:MAG: hypothetical protein HY255_09690 [Betaproteobacteria bacterium]|nr:hypothetical protein [Betaproteobacteria bacterium]